MSDVVMLQPSYGMSFGLAFGRAHRPLSDFPRCELLFGWKRMGRGAWYMVGPLQINWPMVGKELIDAFEALERDGFVGVDAGEGCATACG